MSHRLPQAIFCMAVFLMMFFSYPLMAQAAPTLSTRVSNLESSWGHLRLGGEYSLRADIFHGSPFSTPQDSGNRLLPGFLQEMNVFLEAQASSEFSVQMNFSHQGFWGVSSPSDGNIDKPPLISPLILDEATVRLRKPQLLGDFGRFRFSLDPMGLITDHSSYPIEGLALQTSINGVYVGGYYSRLSSFYQPGSLYINSVDDEIALRIAVPQPKYLLGFTLVPSGLASEQAWALDYAGLWGKRGVQLALAHYKPSPDNYPEYTHDGAWGFLANIDLLPGQQRSLSMKAGYFELGFTPTFSRLSHAVIGDGEPFSPNSWGLSFLYRQTLNKNWDLLGEFTALSPVEYNPVLMTEKANRTMTDWELKALRHFSANTYLEVGYASNDTAIGRYGQVYTGLNLRF